MPRVNPFYKSMLEDNWVLRHEDTIPIVPQPKQRPRTVRRGGKMITRTPQRTIDYEKAIARWIVHSYTVRQRVIAQRLEPVKLEVLCVFARPQRKRRAVDPGAYLWRVGRPDASNLLKAIEDGIEKAKVILEDDAQFVDVRLQKVYGDKEQTPEIKIWIYTLGGDEE